MKNIQEAVALPDPAVQPLVHPLDLPEAHKSFAAAWWLSTLTLPTVFFGIAGILWGVSNNYVTPILVPVIVTACAVVARRYFLAEAWSYIPRSRKDRSRAVPTGWSVIKAALSALVFLLGLVMLIGWFVNENLPAQVLAYSIGMGGGVVLIMAVNLVWTLVTPARLHTMLGSWAAQLVSLVVVAAAVAYAYYAAAASDASAQWVIGEFLAGAAIIVAVQALLWLSKLWPSRKPTP